MKNILKIYKRDLKNIRKNPIALIVVLGLCILPSLYAWFNIKACWDPYGNTKGIKVAVVNNDKGATFNDTDIKIGDQIIDELKTNDKIGWVFVDKEDATYGLTHNKYYASIEIPEDFSEDITTITSSDPVKPKLIYKVNEKSNAIAPKITDKGAQTIVQEVTTTFVDTVNKVVFENLNTLGDDIDQNKSKIIKFKDSIITLNDNMDKIETSVNKAYDGTISLNQFIKDVDNHMPLIEDSLSKLQNVTNSSKDLINTTHNSVSQIIDTATLKLNDVKDLNNKVSSLIDKLKTVSGDNSSAAEIVSQISTNLDTMISKIDSTITFLQGVNKPPFNDVIDQAIKDLENLKTVVNNEQNKLNELKKLLDEGHVISSDALDLLKQGCNDINTNIDQRITSFNNNVKPTLNKIVDDLNSVTDNANSLLTDANKSIPKIKELLSLGKDGSELGIKYVGEVKEQLPEIKEVLGKVSEKLKKVNDDDINTIIEIFRSNPEVMGSYISSPIELVEDRLYQIPNYGSAMTPFYTILALWVGILLLSSIITTEVHPLEDGEPIPHLHEYLGRFLTFATMTVIQSLIVSLGDKFLLGTYITNLGLFVGFSVLSSIIFTLIVYTLVSVFGNVGKAIGIILLVLQVAGSGGTFPIEMTPPFFQKIQPFLPFTYSIGALREAVGGPMYSNVTHDFFILIIFGVVSFILGLLLKKPLSRATKFFHHKFKESGLSE